MNHSTTSDGPVHYDESRRRPGAGPDVLGAAFGGLISWPLAKYAAHRWGLIGALSAGILAGASGGLLVAAGFLIFVLI